MGGRRSCRIAVLAALSLLAAVDSMASAQAKKLTGVPTGMFDAVPLGAIRVEGTRGVALLFPKAKQLRIYPKLLDGSDASPVVAPLPAFATTLLSYRAADGQRFLVFVPSQKKLLEFDAAGKATGEIPLPVAGDDARQIGLVIRPGTKPALLIRPRGDAKALDAIDLATRKPLPSISLAAGGQQELPDTLTIDPTGTHLYGSRSGVSPSGIYSFRFETAVGGGETLRPLVYYHESGSYVSDRRGSVLGTGQRLYDADLFTLRASVSDYFGSFRLLMDQPGLGVLVASDEFAFVDLNAQDLKPLARTELPEGNLDNSLNEGNDRVYAVPTVTSDETADAPAKNVLVTDENAWMLVDLSKLGLPLTPSLRLAVNGPTEVTLGKPGTWSITAATGVTATLAKGPPGASLGTDGKLVWPAANTAGLVNFTLEAKAGDGKTLQQSLRVLVNHPAVELGLFPRSIVIGGSDANAVVAASMDPTSGDTKPPSLATIDRKTMTRLAERKLDQRQYRPPIATDGRHVFIAVGDSDMIDVLDFKTLESVKLIRMPSRIDALQIVGDRLIAGTSMRNGYGSPPSAAMIVDLPTLESTPPDDDASAEVLFGRQVRRDEAGKVIELLGTGGTIVFQGGPPMDPPGMQGAFDTTVNGNLLMRRGGQSVGTLSSDPYRGGPESYLQTVAAPGGLPIIARLESTFTSGNGNGGADAQARFRTWSIRLWDFDGNEHGNLPVEAALQRENDPTKGMLMPCGNDALVAITGPSVQFIPLTMLREAAGQVSAPLQFTRGPDPLVLPSQGKATLKLSVAGGTPPYKFEPFSAPAYIAVDPRSGDVTVDVDAALESMKDAFQQRASNELRYGADARPKAGKASGFFRFATGRDEAGRAATVPVPVRVTDRDGRTVAKSMLVLIDVPATAVPPPAAANASPPKPGPAVPVAGDELARLRAENERLRSENALLKELIQARVGGDAATTRPDAGR